MDADYLQNAIKAANLTDPSINLTMANTRTALYRHFDGEGRLLYVGISLQAIRRVMQHRMYSGWYLNVARIELEWYDDRRSAEIAEKVAIRNENPLHNKAFKKKPSKPKAMKRVLTPRVDVS